MKKTILTIGLLLAVNSLINAQEVYCELLGKGTLFSGKVKVSVDYGNEVTYLKDTEGKKLKFESMIGAMNYMAENGWTYVNSYVVTIGDANVYHYLMRK